MCQFFLEDLLLRNGPCGKDEIIRVQEVLTRNGLLATLTKAELVFFAGNRRHTKFNWS